MHMYSVIIIHFFPVAIITRAWPSKGYIVLDKVSVKYNENQEPVISNVSLHIPPGQKV